MGIHRVVAMHDEDTHTHTHIDIYILYACIYIHIYIWTFDIAKLNNACTSKIVYLDMVGHKSMVLRST